MQSWQIIKPVGWVCSRCTLLVAEGETECTTCGMSKDRKRRKLQREKNAKFPLSCWPAESDADDAAPAEDVDDSAPGPAPPGPAPPGPVSADAAAAQAVAAAAAVIPGKEDETTASEANDLESHPGPHCSMCGKHVDVNQIQHVYNMASVLHCSEKCHETANVIRHTALNNHEFYVSSRDLQADSAKLSISATPGTVAANPQLRAICIGALLPVKRNFAALSRTLLTTLCGLTIKDLKSNNVEIKESISRQIHQASFYNATNRLVHEVMTIHGEMAVAVIKLHIADPKQASLHHDMIILKKERQAKLNGLNLKGELPTDLPTHTRWDHWIHIPVEGELAQLIGSQQSSLTSTASQGKLMQLPSEILMRIMGFQVCAKEHAQFILKQAQDNWERFDVNPVAHNIRQWILKQLDIHISMKHRKLYIHLLDSTLAVINCLCGHYGTNLVHELRDRIAHAQSSCCEEKLNIAMTWLSALHYRIRALSVSQSHAQDITKQQYLSLVCRSLRYLVTAKRGPQYLLKVSNAYALCRPDMRVSALTAASHYMNRWEGDGDYALYSKVAVIASWEGGGLKHGSGMASETHMLWCSVQSDTVSPCILSMGIAPAMLTAEQMYAHMYQARGEPLHLYPGNQQLFEPVVQPIATDHVPGPQDNTMSSEAQDIEHQPGPQGSGSGSSSAAAPEEEIIDIEVFILDADGTVIDRPDEYYRLATPNDFEYCFCNQDSDHNCVNCGKCGHCCEGECRNYTRWEPDDFETRSAFYDWLLNCTCGCDDGSCIDCYLCQGCCTCAHNAAAEASEAAATETKPVWIQVVAPTGYTRVWDATGAETHPRMLTIWELEAPHSEAHPPAEAAAAGSGSGTGSGTGSGSGSGSSSGSGSGSGSGAGCDAWQNELYEDNDSDLATQPKRVRFNETITVYPVTLSSHHRKSRQTSRATMARCANVTYRRSRKCKTQSANAPP